jgi:hypothetical protein
MSVSRRRFMKAGVVAAACAVIPAKSALGREGLATRKGSMLALPQQSSKIDPNQLGYYTEASFAPYLNTQFRVYLDRADTRALKLLEVSDYFAAVPRSTARASSSPNTECFSLLLTAPPGKPFEQDTYLIEHEALGNFYLFLVPVSAQGKTALNYYEAVVYRSPDLPKAPESAPVKNKGPLERGAAGVVLQDSSDGSRTNQEVYYFRPKANPSSAVKEQPVDPGAAGRRAASKLSIAQSPAIGGLRLGMTPEQVLALFPGIKDDAKFRPSLDRPASQFGEKSFVIKPGKYSSRDRFDRATQITVTFLDGRVTTFSVRYDGPVWDNVDQFVEKFSAETSLPGADSWDAYTGMDTQLKTLKCMDFEISLFAGGSNVDMNYVQIRDTSAQQRLRDRRAKARTLRGANS